MSNVKQAVVLSEGAYDPNKSHERLRLFNPDGSPFSSGGTAKYAQITFPSANLVTFPDDGAGATETLNGYGLAESAKFPPTVTDPDGILEITGQEIRLTEPGFWIINADASVQPTGGADKELRTDITHYNWESSNQGAARRAVKHTDVQRLADLQLMLYLTPEEVANTHIVETLISTTQLTSGNWVINNYKVNFTVVS